MVYVRKSYCAHPETRLGKFHSYLLSSLSYVFVRTTPPPPPPPNPGVKMYQSTSVNPYLCPILGVHAYQAD